MNPLNDALVDKIVETCVKLYTKLPKTGKPVEKEWTVLSCIVKLEKDTKAKEVVALGTGTKCLGASQLSPAGDVVHDSHAEVMARRGFLIYLYDQIAKARDKNCSIFVYADGKLRLKDCVEFIFFSSQLPCGDASIIPKIGDQEHFGEVLQMRKHKATEDICDTETKVSKLICDIHRTGAKCLPGALQDTKESGSKYHVYGQVRTKPGRGERTLSVSCSDKMARWVHIGIQGGLLNMLCGPIFINHFVFGGGVQFSKESLHRALIARDSEGSIEMSVTPRFYQSSLNFPHLKKDSNERPAAGCIVWIGTGVPIYEVAVQGKKLGVTKKNFNNLKSALCVSKVRIYQIFQEVVNNALYTGIREQIIGTKKLESIPYSEMKRKSVKYLERWLEVKEKFFKMWTVKPDICNFCIAVKL